MRVPAWIASRRAASGALGLAAIIILTLPLAPKIWVALLPHLGPNPILLFLAVGMLAALLLAGRSWRASKDRRGNALALLALAFILWIALLFGYYRGEKPVKRFHALEYGALALLAFDAVRVDPRDRRGIVTAILFLLVVGTLDEAIQGFVPGRTFRWLDLFGNHLSSAIGAIAWGASSPGSPWRRRTKPLGDSP
jgi:hypothetical protein